MLRLSIPELSQSGPILLEVGDCVFVNLVLL